MTPDQMIVLSENYEIGIVQIPDRVNREGISLDGFPIRFYSFENTLCCRVLGIQYVIEKKNCKFSWIMVYQSDNFVDAEVKYNSLLRVD